MSWLLIEDLKRAALAAAFAIAFALAIAAAIPGARAADGSPRQILSPQTSSTTASILAGPCTSRHGPAGEGSGAML